MNNILQAAMKWLDDGELFREAVERTARDRGYPGELIEKDFFCSLALSLIAENMPEPVVFKGGTCLSKVYADFYRLSEDLDFAVSVPVRSSRSERRRLIKPVKELCGGIEEHCPPLKIIEALRGANQSTHYFQALEYQSPTTGRTAQIRMEFGLREPLLLPPTIKPAGTLLANPLTGRALFPPFPVRVMAIKELWSEKTRAALCRRTPAIRDFFDLDFARVARQLDFTDPEFIALAGRKIKVPGNIPPQLDDARLAELECQQDTDLRPVLRSRDFERFDLNRIWTDLVALMDKL